MIKGTEGLSSIQIRLGKLTDMTEEEFRRIPRHARAIGEHEQPSIPEIVIPIAEIPPKYRLKVPLPDSGTQIIDIRHCYEWQPGRGGGRFVVSSMLEAADLPGFNRP